jgi:kynurenine formamidase
MIRSTPNEVSKKSEVWSGNNPPYFTLDAMQYLVDLNLEHLLTDLPSVDPEEDAGALAAHRIWWQYPSKTRLHSSITELIFVDDSIEDGLYLLNLMVPKIASDAVPSQPIIYPLSQI